MRNRSRSYHYLSALTVLLVLPCGAAASAAEDVAREAGASTERRANGLINETSPYLLQHAYNPVDWLPWGDEAIERARREQKPILLSVGYSTCYWCHVMEREVFENEEIAQQLNQQFVCVKVDREERPDIDGVYMTATQILIRRGGWPMNVFLTPPAKDATGADAVGYGLKPFFCTTYLPAEPKDGLPSFPQVSGRMHALWTDRRDQVLDQAERLASAVQRVMADSADGGPVTAASVRSAGDAVLDEYDPQHGGFGNATRGQKFPQPSKLAMLLTVSHLDSDAPKNARQAVLHTLDQMARGGIFDQVGGGFHRYSTDPQWSIPHFEKMLYDNAQLLSVYAQALRLERQSGEGDARRAQRYERVLRETADYLLEEMADESGAFWSAQDAEVDGREGLSYLWTPQEVRQAIGDASLADLAAPMYGLDRDPNFKDPHAPDAPPAYVLHLPTPLEELARRRGLTLAELLEKRRQINQQLKAARDERDLPATDDKVIVSWNGLAIRGLAHAGEVLNEPRYVAAAEKAADAILTHMAAAGDALYRTMRAEQPQGAALLEDYTHLAAGLLALAQVSQDDRYRREAERLTLHARDQFGAETGGYYDTRSGQDDLFVRVRLIYDDATPSGNSVMVQNLLTLHEQTGEPLWLSRAVQDLRSFAAEIDQQGASMPGMVQAWWRAAQSQDAKAGLTAP